MRVKVIISLITLSICFSSQANEKPNGQITFKVVDESGKPVAGATVRMSTFLKWQPGPEFGKDIHSKTENKTDAAGLVTLSLPSVTGEFAYGVGELPGFYRGGGGRHKFSKNSGGRWEPWSPTIDIVVRPILNPVAMYSRRVRAMRVPEDGKPIGFDLIESDWVAPYGKGKTTDFIFKIERQFESFEKPFDAILTLTFSNDGDGIQSVLAKSYVDSALRLPRHAPEDGYESKLIRKIFRDPGQPIVSDVRENQNYFFRVRTEKKNGKIVSALYGKIHDDIQFWASGEIRLTYYLNPAPNDRNMESDPQKNLFANRKGIDRPSEP